MAWRRKTGCRRRRAGNRHDRTRYDVLRGSDPVLDSGLHLAQPEKSRHTIANTVVLDTRNWNELADAQQVQRDDRGGGDRNAERNTFRSTAAAWLVLGNANGERLQSCAPCAVSVCDQEQRRGSPHEFEWIRLEWIRRIY